MSERGSLPNADGTTISHLEPAGICISTSRIPAVGIWLIFMLGVFCAGWACAGRSPNGYGGLTSRSTVLDIVGLAPLPVSRMRYCTPLGSTFTPALLRFCARKASLLVLLSTEAFSNADLALASMRCIIDW